MRRPGPWLAAVTFIALLATLDACRPPQKQITARIYLAAVGFYQRDIHPWTMHYIRCRYSPTCSHYSVEAVKRFGIARGLWLTATRVASCNHSVPMGTYDPLPASWHRTHRGANRAAVIQQVVGTVTTSSRANLAK
jgi:hypothetical protein